LYVAWFQRSHRNVLRQRAYGRYLVHVLTYLLVNASYWLPAALLAATGNADRLDAAWHVVDLGCRAPAAYARGASVQGP